MIKPVLAYVGIAWLILQVVVVLTDVLRLDPIVGTATLLILTFGLPAAIYLCWHFDVSLSGISRTPGLDEQENPKIEPFGVGSWLGLVAIISISGFIGVQYFDSIKQDQLVAAEEVASAKRADSIAVLPFADLSTDRDQGYLALGLSEEITSLLGRTDSFRVSASRSGQILAEKGMAPLDIGRRLGVETVLTGSVSAEDDRVKVRVELLETDSGHTLWTESFQRGLIDIFAIESEIGRSVVNLLQDKYLEAGDLNSLSTTSSTDAYVLYLKGREQYRKQTTESMQAARDLFEQAIALDPEYARAYVALADTLAQLSEGSRHFGVLEPQIAANLARLNLDKAMLRQPDIAEIYAVKGLVYYLLDEYGEAVASLDKAIALNPSLAIAYLWKNLALDALQRFDESFKALETAHALDPLFVTTTYNLGVELTRIGEFSEAKALFEQLKDDFPDSTFSYQGLADLYFSQGNFVDSIREIKKAVEISPDKKELVFRMLGPISQLGLSEILKEKTTDPFWQATILIFEKKYEELFEKMDFEVAANPEEYWVAFEAGWYHSMFGDKSKALTLLTEKHSLISDEDKFYMPMCSPAIEIAWAYNQLGEIDKSQKILSKCKALMNEQKHVSISYFELDYLAARIHALEQKPQEAIEFLSKSISNGWREWWTQYDPLLKSLKTRDEFEQHIQFINDDLAKQRVETLKLFDKEL